MITVCGVCHAAHHEECWTDNRGCAVTACAGGRDSAHATYPAAEPLNVLQPDLGANARSSTSPQPVLTPHPPPSPQLHRAEERRSGAAMAAAIVVAAAAIGGGGVAAAVILTQRSPKQRATITQVAGARQRTPATSIPASSVHKTGKGPGARSDVFSSTTTSQPPPTPSTPLKPCYQNIDANAYTSCPFAYNIFYQYAMRVQRIGAPGSFGVTAYSPTTKLDYNDSCKYTASNQLVVCSHGSDLIEFPYRAAAVYQPG